MARPLRIEYPGALYHITARGDRREAIYEDDVDRERFLTMLGQVVHGWNWHCHAYCLMPNHYHLVIETPDGNLAKGMRQLNGVYTQASNRRHRRVGHLFQGRYKAILVDADTYLLELVRYVVLNPIRAGLVEDPHQWRWSSYLVMIGKQAAPTWLTIEAVLGQFSSCRRTAMRQFSQFVADGSGQGSLWKNLTRQIFLGDEHFVARMQAMTADSSQDVNIPKAQRRPPAPSLPEIAQTHTSRDKAIVVAHATGEYSYQQIAAYFGLHFTTVGRIVRRQRGDVATS